MNTTPATRSPGRACSPRVVQSTMTDSFLKAIRDGDFPAVDTALAGGAHPGAEREGEDGLPQRPLSAAAASGHLAIVTRLIGAGADPSAGDDEALSQAACHGHLAVVDYLLSVGGDPDASDHDPLYCAVLNEHLPVVERLLAAGADVHAHEDDALELAISNADCRITRALLQGGADVHARNDSLLPNAAAHWNAELVDLLRDHGADGQAAIAVVAARGPTCTTQWLQSTYQRWSARQIDHALGDAPDAPGDEQHATGLGL